MRNEHEGAGRVSRRSVLRAAGGLALVLAGASIAVVRTRGYVLTRPTRPVSLSTWQFVVVQHAARRIAAPDRPDDPSIPTPDEVDVTGTVDAWVARMRPAVRRDMGRFLAYLEHLAPLAKGYASRFTRLAPEAQDAVLASLETSPHDLLRAGFDGLKALVFIGYYRDPRTWAIAGYDGPLVGRPPGGWR
jgi:hypothetical protein